MQVPPELEFYEVHFWPHDGRLLVVDKRAHRDRPVLTFLQVTGADGVPVDDAAYGIAAALGAAAGLEGPQATVVLHDRHGNILATPGGLGLPAVALRRVTNR